MEAVVDDDVVGQDSDDEAVVAQEPAAPEGAEDRAPRRWLRWVLRGAAAVLVLGVLGGAGYAGWLLYAQHQRQVSAHQALAAAEKFAVDFTNADPTTIDQAIDAITEGSTGEFKERYVRSISQLRAMLIENKVTTRGTVVRSAIESVNGNTVDVLMFVRQSFTSAAVPEPPAEPGAQAPPGPATEVVGMEVTMEKVGGRWLASKVIPGDKL